MNAVGIDISKGKSMVAVARPFGEIISKPFVVHHTSAAISELISYLHTLNGDTRIVMEHTGRYYEPMARCLADADFFVSTVNPKLIKDYGTNSLRKVKTDKADALKIARYALDNWQDLCQYTNMDTLRNQLKTMNRQFAFYTKQKISYKNNLIALLDMTYPGVNTLFDSPVRSDGSQKWVDFASSFWHADCVRSLGLSAFTERYRKWCKRHGYNFQPLKPKEIFESSKDLIAIFPKDSMSKLLIKQAIDQLNAVSATVEYIRAEMNRIASELPEYPIVMAMCGVGTSLGPQLMAEIGDLSSFRKREALTAFAGVDPGANQSGKYEAQSVHTSKRGSPRLRKTLFQIMDCLIKTMPPDDAVYQFMDKKRSEGKPYYVYMTAGANKFLRIYYGRVKEYLSSLSETE
ncbi:MAG: IS110 family transposase [Clostridia bacterium]|nr:IS110 family transposase [Clostridia bacterium]